MTKWIILLRGINVSGQKKIIMSELRALLAGNDFSNVESYIQSGNIICDSLSPQKPEFIQEKIQDIIKTHYGFEVDVFAIEPHWLAKVAAKNPYLQEPDIDQKQLYLAILNKVPASENLGRLQSFEAPGDDYVLDRSVIYLHYTNGAGKAKLTNNLIETKLKVKATSRNWNTVMKLLALAS